MSKKIFISYKYDEDNHYKNLLLAWSKNSSFDFNFNDTSVDVSINSTDANYIKSVIKNRISSSPYFLCIIGENTYISDWVIWEIETAVFLNKRIIAVKTSSTNTTPDELKNIGAKWAMSFTFSSITDAIDEA